MGSDNQCDNRADTRPAVRGGPQASVLPFELACGMACVRADIRSGARGDVQGEPSYSLQGTFCEYGLSALQINVLALAQKAGTRIMPYGRIASQLMQEFGVLQSAESVRGIVKRLTERGFLRRKQARDGTIRGVRFTIVDAMICPHITPVQADTRCGVRSDVRPEHFAASSILKETNRKNTLSISSEKAGREVVNRLEALTEDDIAFHWPKLARLDFGTHQIRQILQRLEQVSIGPERIIQGLIYAEWDDHRENVRCIRQSCFQSSGLGIQVLGS